jgi:A/G-specific adenine glycosylase
LVAEILLKKTTAPVVNRFLPAFLGKYPTIQNLAGAKPRQLQRFLKPLGLSRQRAHQFTDLAREIVSRYGGKIPDRPGDLLELPGVGEYTANALRSAAFGRPAPIVDTNVARVLLRVYDISPSRFEARRSPEVWAEARKLTGRDATRSKKINWALLDLAALVCLPKNPKCHVCPLSEGCVYGQARLSM